MNITDLLTKNDDVFTKALETFGHSKQASMCMGECGELIAELNRYYGQGRGDTTEVVDGIADVVIMTHQMSLLFGVERVKVRVAEKIEKLKRKFNA